MMKNSHYFSLFCCLFFFLNNTVVNAQVETDLAQANQFMVNKKYEQAADVYEGLVAKGYTGSSLHYNLGNAWYRAGNIGKAILNYERALRLNPSDQATLTNLKVAKAQLKDEIVELEPFFLYRWWRGLLGLFTASVWAVLGILLLWGALYFGYQYLYGKERAQRKNGFIRGLSLGAVGLLLIFMAFRQHKIEADSAAAIILAAEAPLCSAPNDIETVIQTLHAGTKVYLLDEIGEWQLVRLSNGDRGWMNEQVMEKI